MDDGCRFGRVVRLVDQHAQALGRHLHVALEAPPSCVQGVAELESSHIDGVELAILAVLDQRRGDAAQILLIVREVVQIEHVVGV